MDVKGEISSGSPTRIRVPMPCIGAEQLVVARKSPNRDRAKELYYSVL